MSGVRSGLSEWLQRRGSALAARLGHAAPIVRWARPFYGAALAWMAADRGAPWSINGVNYRIDVRYRDRMGHDYEPAVASFLKGLIQPGFVCYDVGASVGAYVLQLCHWAGPSGRVVAFEPNPEALQVLRRHVAMNGLDQQVEIVPAAVGAGEDHAVLFADGTDLRSRLGAPNPDLAGQAHAVTVPLLTIDGFVHAGHAAPDLMLVDVEGYELNVLTSARQTINERGHRLHIVVEMHPTLWPLAGTDGPQMAAFLEAQGFRPRGLTGQSDPLAEYGLVYLERR